MADADFASVNAALEQRIRSQVKKQYNRSDVTLNLIPKVMGNGKNLAWDISVGTATGQVFDDGQVVSVFNNDTEVLCTLPWAEYGDAFKVTGRAEDAANGDNTELGRLFMFKLMQARERAASKVNTDIWSGAGTAAPQLLYGITITAGPLDSTGSYAGQSRVTYPQWAGNVLANGGVSRAISLSLLEYAFEVVFTASGTVPTFGITTPAIWRHLAELAGGEKRVNQDAYIRGQKLPVSMGFHSVEINGVPIFRDKDATSGTLALFNEDHIMLEWLPVAPSRVQRGKILARVPLGGTPQEQTEELGAAPGGAGPLMASLIPLPSQGNFDSWMLDSTIQLKADRCNAHCLIKDIATTTP